MKIKNNTWETVEKMAKDRQKWRTFVAALHANGISGSFTFSLYVSLVEYVMVNP